MPCGQAKLLPRAKGKRISTDLYKNNRLTFPSACFLFLSAQAPKMQTFLQKKYQNCGETLQNPHLREGEAMTDTICALATAPARAAIGVIRLSGPEAFRIAGEVLRYAGDNRLIGENEKRNLSFGRICDGDETVDEAVICAFRAPHSYTGEDSVEFSCHGGVYLLSRVQGLLISHGARPAQAGEFTKRAFLNGKTDLIRAEGVVDLIDADHREAARLALRSLEGAVGQAVKETEEQLLAVAAQLLAFVDYPDDEIGEVDPGELKMQLDQIERRLTALCDSYEQGRLIREGVRTVLCGRPNVGKSSLLNRIAGQERAIVTDQAGTTRDTVDIGVIFGGCKLILTDTAGLRETNDAVERIGVDRAYAAAEQADLVLCVFDGDDGDLSLGKAWKEQGKTVAVLFNKRDLSYPLPDLPYTPDGVFEVSAKTGAGLDALGAWLQERYGAGRQKNGEIIAGERQHACLVRVTEAVRRAQAALDYSCDAVLLEIESALAAVGELTGKTVSDRIVNEIFSRFCVGK